MGVSDGERRQSQTSGSFSALIEVETLDGETKRILLDSGWSFDWIEKASEGWQGRQENIRLIAATPLQRSGQVTTRSRDHLDR